MSAEKRFNELPSDWVTFSVKNCVVNALKGKTATAKHPITSINPKETFVITEVKIEPSYDDELGKVYVRGKDTCWFGHNLVKIYVGM
jgi:hypothetical protein